MAATALAGFSWGVNVGYFVGGGWLARGAGVELEEGEVRLEVVRRRERRKARGDVEGEQSLLHDSESSDSDSEHTARASASPPSASGSATPPMSPPHPHGTVPDPLVMSQHEAEAVVARKKHVILHDIVKLGDVFWLFLLLNCEFLPSRFFVCTLGREDGTGFGAAEG